MFLVKNVMNVSTYFLVKLTLPGSNQKWPSMFGQQVGKNPLYYL